MDHPAPAGSVNTAGAAGPDEPEETAPLLRRIDADAGKDGLAEPERRRTCWERTRAPFVVYPKTCICLGVTLVLVVLSLTVIVPQVAMLVMGKYIQQVNIEVQELEVLAISGGVADVRLQAVMSIDAPITVAGRTEPTEMNMLIGDPTNNYALGVLGVVKLPAVETESLTIFLNITTTLRIVSDKLFHVLLTDVVANSTISAVLDGDLAVTAYVPLYSELTRQEHLTKSVSLVAMNGLVVSINTIDYVSSTPTDLYLQLNFTVYNPAQFFASTSLLLYDEDLRMYHLGGYMGQLYAGSLLIGKGASNNSAVGRLVLNNDTEATVSLFLSGFLTGRNVTASLLGTAKVDIGLPRTPDDPAVLDFSLTLEGPQGLITDAYVRLRDVDPLPPPNVGVTAVARLYNPLLFEVAVDSFATEFFLLYSQPGCNETVASTDSGPPFVVGAGLYECVPLDLVTTYAYALCMQQALDSDEGLWVILTNVKMVARLVEFVVTLYFDYGPVQGFQGTCRP